MPIQFDLFWTVLSGLSLAGSALGSVHLLLHYRRATTAMAWFLALWALPGLGLGMYLTFSVYEGPRRVRNRRRLSKRLRQGPLRTSLHGKVPVSGEDPHTCRVAESLEGLPLIPGNRVELHGTVKAAREALFELIGGARSELLLEGYIWRDDAFTAELSGVLAERARAGVNVRVLIDPIGSHALTRRATATMRQAGVLFETFLAPSPFKGRFQINFRNHRKLIVADGERAILGGRNFAAGYYDEGPGGIRDLSFTLEGPSVAVVHGVFHEDWVVATGGEDRELELPRVPERAGDRHVRVIPHGQDEEDDVYVPILSSAIRGAQSTLLIVTPYFVPGTRLLHDVRMAALAGVHVRLLLPERSPERIPDFAARRIFGGLRRLGIEITLCPAPFLHAKAIVIDDRWVLLGSANFDQRSFALNYEISCEILGEETAAAVCEYFASDFARGKPLDDEAFAKRPWYQRMAENAAALFWPIL